MMRMPNLYFPIGGFLIAILLVITYFIRKRASENKSERKIYSIMLIASLIDTILSIILIYLGYTEFEQRDLIATVLNKLDFLQYLVWANMLFLYVAEISLGAKKGFRKAWPYIVKICIAIDIIAYLFIIVLPLKLFNENDVMYAYGAPVNLLYALCGVYLIAMFAAALSNIRKIISRKYIPVFALLALGVIIMIVRSTNPGLLIIPAAIAYINLIMYFTIENPDRKALELQAKILKVTNHAKNMAVKADQVKNDFLSLASHQLRTPLTSIRGYSSMLLEGVFGEVPEELRKTINEINMSSNRMVYLVDDLLNISRIQAGKFAIMKAPVDLGKLISLEAELVKALSDSRDVKITYNDKNWDKLPPVEIDEGKIGEVISNMIDNAVFYSRAGSTVHVTLVKHGNFIEFRVKDHGIGVPKSEWKSLFTKFYRATNARVCLQTVKVTKRECKQ